MKTRATLKNAKNNPFLVFLARYHSILFFVVLSAGIFAALFMLLGILNATNPNDAATDTQAINTSFDEATIKRLQELSDGNVTPFTPSGRTNPFVE